MISVLSQILHNNRAFMDCDYSTGISPCRIDGGVGVGVEGSEGNISILLEKYALTKSAREQWSASVPVPVPDAHPETVREPETAVQPVGQRAPKAPETYTPTQSNSLFWCVFIAHYGLSDYIKIGNRYSNAEIEEKQTIMETVSKTPRALKDTNHKLTNQTLQELYSALMVNKRDDLFTAIAFSVFYHLKIYVVFANKTHIVYIPSSNTEREDAPKPVIIHCKVGSRNNVFSLEIDITPERVQELESSSVRLETWNKPLKGVSSYKLPELECLAAKLGVDVSGLKKGDLYNKIAEVCSLERVLHNI